LLVNHGQLHFGVGNATTTAANEIISVSGKKKLDNADPQ
jgi:hypothetical protein